MKTTNLKTYAICFLMAICAMPKLYATHKVLEAIKHSILYTNHYYKTLNSTDKLMFGAISFGLGYRYFSSPKVKKAPFDANQALHKMDEYIKNLSPEEKNKLVSRFNNYDIKNRQQLGPNH